MDQICQSPRPTVYLSPCPLEPTESPMEMRNLLANTWSMANPTRWLARFCAGRTPGTALAHHAMLVATVPVHVQTVVGRANALLSPPRKRAQLSRARAQPELQTRLKPVTLRLRTTSQCTSKALPTGSCLKQAQLETTQAVSLTQCTALLRLQRRSATSTSLSGPRLCAPGPGPSHSS